MKLIHCEKGSKIFLGNNFTSNLNVILSKAKLQHNKITELFDLTRKYMNFAYENAPVKIDQKEYELIIKKYA